MISRSFTLFKVTCHFVDMADDMTFTILKSIKVTRPFSSMDRLDLILYNFKKIIIQMLNCTHALTAMLVA